MNLRSNTVDKAIFTGILLFVVVYWAAWFNAPCSFWKSIAIGAASLPTRCVVTKE